MLEFQVGYEGADMSTGIGPAAQSHDTRDADMADEGQGLPVEAAGRVLGKAEVDSRLRLLQAARAQHSRSTDQDDLQQLGLL